MMVGPGSFSDISANGKPADPAETYAASLLPTPPAGREAGYRRNASVPAGEFVFVLDLR